MAALSPAVWCGIYTTIITVCMGFSVHVSGTPVTAVYETTTSCQSFDNGTGLDCSNLGLWEVPQNLSSDLLILNLSGNNITELDAYVFSELTLLRYLDLSASNVVRVSSNAFVGLQSLETLLLSDNNITAIPDRTLKDTPLLRHISLRGNFFMDVPKALTLPQNLQVLDLSHNMILKFNFDKSFENLQTLLELNLEGNKITSIISENFVGLNGTKLQILDLSYNNLETINQDSFQYFADITYLDLSRNLLTPTYMGEVLYGLQDVKLKRLCLREMAWTEISNSTFLAMKKSTLKILDLSSNYLRKITPNSFPLPSLRHLDLSYNKLEHIAPPVFADLRHLKILNLTGNRMSNYPDLSTVSGTLQTLVLSQNKLSGEIPQSAFRGLNKISSLDVSMNQITGTLQPGIFGSQEKELERLNLSYNQISNISKYVFHNTTSIVTLDLSHNNLTEIPGFVPFQHLFHCTYLDLSYNNISSIISNTFAGMFSLKHLDLGQNVLSDGNLFMHNSTVFLPMRQTLTTLLLYGNSLDTIHPGTFQSLKQLILLDLSDNNIDQLSPGIFGDLVNLLELDLHSNLISTVNSSTFMGLTSLEVLNMVDNPFSCTCDLQWFRYWLDDTNITVINVTEYICVSPSVMEGEPVLAFDPEIICNKGPAQIISLCLVSLTVFCVALVIGCRAAKGCRTPKGGSRLYRYAAVPHKEAPSPGGTPAENQRSAFIKFQNNNQTLNNDVESNGVATIPMKPLPQRKVYGDVTVRRQNDLQDDTLESSESEMETRLDARLLTDDHASNVRKSTDSMKIEDSDSKNVLVVDSDEHNQIQKDDNESSSSQSVSSHHSNHESYHGEVDTQQQKSKDGSDKSSQGETNGDGAFDEDNTHEETGLLKADESGQNSTEPAETSLDPDKITSFRPVKYSV
ncbi:insulin-like growth factor-binding protein complex acid labile subunit [Ptychodera flava]|uniref:insulin-like growth factor-binding protein complex acid labile subunit n=1 Tax=Ptychodera flava TaxID=63121 RepID=UPI00396A4283